MKEKEAIGHVTALTKEGHFKTLILLTSLEEEVDIVIVAAPEALTTDVEEEVVLVPAVLAVNAPENVIEAHVVNVLENVKEAALQRKARETVQAGEYSHKSSCCCCIERNALKVAFEALCLCRDVPQLK